VTADVDEHDGARPAPLGAYDEIVERHAQIAAVAVGELDRCACLHRRERRRHERIRGHDHGAAADAGELERRERSPGPAGEGDRRQPIPRRPNRFEALDHRSLAPALRLEDVVPELVQTRAVAVVEADAK
jgi:hypothetical protein